MRHRAAVRSAGDVEIGDYINGWEVVDVARVLTPQKMAWDDVILLRLRKKKVTWFGTRVKEKMAWFRPSDTAIL